jgi:hypothetical protein
VAVERYTTDGARLFQFWVALAGHWEAAARGERSTAVALAMNLAEQTRSRGQVTFQPLRGREITTAPRFTS